MRDRQQAVADFFSREGLPLFRAVRHAIGGSNELVEDACSYAWAQLVTHDEVQLDRAGFGWLYVVAVREAYRLSASERRELPFGKPEDLPVRGEVVPPVTSTSEQRQRDRARLILLAELPPRRRRMVVLHAAGFTYREIAAITGATLRTVERQLLRGKRTLRRMDSIAEAQR